MSEDKYIQDEESYDANDKAQVNNARKKSKREKILQDEVIRKLMETADGRRWINTILEDCFMFGNPHVRGDVYETHINIGMANAGKMIWSQLEEASPEFCGLMLKEAKTKVVKSHEKQ